MQIIQTPKQALNPAFLKQKPERKEIELFKTEFMKLLDNIKSTENKETEEHYKIDVMNFLNYVYYRDNHYLNTKGHTDFVIHNGKTPDSPVGVLIEVKSPVNKAEMVNHENLNVKSFQELVLYYLRERKTGNNFELRYLIITNIYEWFVFDAQDFEKLFYRNKNLLNHFEQFHAGKLSGTSTDFFYKEIASPEIQKLQPEIPYTHFDIRDYDKILRNADKEDDRKLIALYKFLSPVHLLKQPFANDNNQLNKDFYTELLHIIGLEEIKQDNRKLIVRKKENERDNGSIIENAIERINVKNKLDNLNVEQLGKTAEEQLFSVALDLAITWINRILFLKLLESQIVKYHNGNKDYAFLSTDKLTDYNDLDTLFFSVLARKEEERKENVKAKFAHVPYLNSSLFEMTEIEDKTICIDSLQDNIQITLYPKSVLHSRGVSHTLQMKPLEYLLHFLDAYDFSSEGSEEIQEENKPLISASVLGLIFEKINGYKDGSFFTPAFITMYMCRETISKAVIQKFNEAKEWNCQSINDLYNKIEDIVEANRIFNSIRICDPSVGSGHFLVSALNEMISLKSELGILTDKNGKKLKDYRVTVANDELIITNEENNYFNYNPQNVESQRVQEAFFYEKQTMIENCLFGVDINPNSVKICQLRLWIELLKHTYYRSGTNKLETLPNIDINIKCGNSLISRFDLRGNYSTLPSITQQKLQKATRDYKAQVILYKCMNDKATKKLTRENIARIKATFSQINNPADTDYRKWKDAETKSTNHFTSLRFDEDKDVWNKQHELLQAETDTLREKYKQKIKTFYTNAFEWSFEFPEVLDDNGNFVGFDVVIGNPPYIQLQSMGSIADAYKNMNYQVFERMGDIYCLFYELAHKLLKQNGYLSYITSNTWMRAGHGEKTRQFLVEQTNPMLLIDFSDVKVFDEATVRVNILMLQKDKNKQQTQACIVKKEGIKDLSVYIRQNAVSFRHCGLDPQSPDKNTGESWVILSPIEQRIKAKIEAVGTPLKDWNIKINYGIKTGFNGNPEKDEGCFIISGKQRAQLIAEDPKSAEIIRPILRGRDIKRYGYDFADLWLINTHNGIKEKGIKPIDISDYPAIKNHLDNYFPELEKRADKGDTPYNLRNCAYIEDFYKQKIVWLTITDKPKFAIDLSGAICLNSIFFMIGNSHLYTILASLNSKLIEWYFDGICVSTGVGTNKWEKFVVEKIPIPMSNTEFEQKIEKMLQTKEYNEIDKLIYKLYNLTEEEIEFIESQ
ncbi:type II restriction endonuclease [Bacteroidia bacterium]|nr:type II restriction endonuclease [Bacteroidia bacterium]